MITTVSPKKRKKSVIRKRHVLFSLRIIVGKNKGSSPKRAEGTAMFTAAKLKCCVMSWSPRPNYASSSWSQERFSNSHSQPGKPYQHLSVTSFLQWGANGTVFLWNQVLFLITAMSPRSLKAFLSDQFPVHKEWHFCLSWSMLEPW